VGDSASSVLISQQLEAAEKGTLREHKFSLNPSSNKGNEDFLDFDGIEADSAIRLNC